MVNEENYINLSLTIGNCSRRGFYWIQDILFYENPLYGTFAVFRHSLDKGYKLGKPKIKRSNMFGLYVPKRLAHERLSNIYNPLLTPSHAKEYGYEYKKDVIYNILTPDEKMIKEISSAGYKLGISAQEDTTEAFFGLYAPLSKKL